MIPLRIVVAPDGVAIAKDAQEAVPSPRLLWTLAPVLAALVRPMLDDPRSPKEVDTNIVRADEAGIIWQVGPWVVHGSDLRAGTLDSFFELVSTARVRGAVAAASGAPAPVYVMAGVSADEGIPVGFIVQVAAKEAPLPMVSFPLPKDVQTMWLVASRLGLAARLGEVGLSRVLEEVAQTRRAHGSFSAAFEPTLKMLADKYAVAPDDAVAAMILEGWESDGGGAKAIEAFVAAAQTHH